MTNAKLSPELEEKLSRTRQMILDATAHYGEPTMTLEELRAKLDEEMGDRNLSDLIIEQRRGRG